MATNTRHDPMESTEAAHWRQKRRHDLKEASQTLCYLIDLIEQGYQFDDEDAKPLLGEMRKIVSVLDAEFNFLAPSPHSAPQGCE